MKRHPLLGILGKLAVNALGGAVEAVLEDMKEGLTEVDSRFRRARRERKMPEVLYRHPRSNKWEVVDPEDFRKN